MATNFFYNYVKTLRDKHSVPQPWDSLVPWAHGANDYCTGCHGDVGFLSLQKLDIIEDQLRNSPQRHQFRPAGFDG